MSGKVINVGFIGNPNCGKTTLFNAYTGANLKVANWPGVTVEKKEGYTTYKGQEFKLIDLPGIYSLTSYTMEEKVSRECIMSDEVDVIVDVVDASCLERNLYLTLQLIELGKPVVLALNMMDIVEERGMEIDLHRLPEMLGIPAIPVSARKRSGLEILMHAVAHHKEYAKPGPFIHHHSDKTGHKHDHHSEYAMVYNDEIEDKIDAIIEQFRKKYPDMENMRWHAIKTLEQDETVTEQFPVDMSGIADRSYEKDIINQKYDFIEEVIEETLVNKNEKAEKTEHVDRYMTSKWLGLPIFLVIMALVFFLTFTVGDWLKGYFETGLDLLTGAVSAGLEACGQWKGMRHGRRDACLCRNAEVIDHGIIRGEGFDMQLAGEVLQTHKAFMDFDLAVSGYHVARPMRVVSEHGFDLGQAGLWGALGRNADDAHVFYTLSCGL